MGPGSILQARSSAFDPAGPVSEAIARLTEWMTWVFGAVFIVVMVLIIFAVFAKHNPEKKKTLNENWFIIAGGLIFPSVVLFVLLVYALVLTARISFGEEKLLIQMTGHMWWWDVHYPSHNVSVANEIYVPVGKPVRIELRSRDVIHSLWVPSLAGKVDLVPGMTNSYYFEASQPGVFRGQCAEYCGLQHARMGLYVVALSEEDFATWIKERQHSAPLDSPEKKSGFVAFKNKGCATCHTIRGTEAIGQAGPDLTHMGSRLSLGAGLLPNTFGNLAGWISNPQALKPGNKMPRTYLDARDLHLISHYLMSLK